MLLRTQLPHAGCYNYSVCKIFQSSKARSLQSAANNTSKALAKLDFCLEALGQLLFSLLCACCFSFTS